MALALSPTTNPDSFLKINDQNPPSMEKPKGPRISLPSISSLIEAANEASENGVERSPKEESRRISATSQNFSQTQDKQMPTGSPRTHPPSTPPLTQNLDFPRHSPVNSSPTSAGGTHATYYNHPPSTSNPEFFSGRHSAYPPLPDEMNSWHPPQYNHSPTDSSAPETLPRPSVSSYPDLPDEKNHYPGLAQQRPLPDNFPPPLASQPPVQPAPPLPPIDPQMAPPVQYYQHHHGFPQNNPPTYQQHQERYVCSVCNKPFSRPSSLKIHTYSHTGEKPYKCKVEGCNKWFSVRSNMKRHEKGCHGADGTSASSNSPKAL